MKRLVLGLLIGFFVAAPAFSAVNKENCGCGLGTLMMQDMEGTLWEVFAVTTNGTFGNGTFGISSGTLGCEKPANFAMRERLDIFVADNMDSLAVDIAAGKGETLDTLAELAELDESRQGVFFTALQSNFDEIYPNGDVTSTEVVDKITIVLEHI
ncbi:DUF3015 domain-containing protein [Desulfococcaceae bacterium OttesenSCG-928-F15]|nr:DUF3015 domain-containing protein [Desulfococcaceae bacterium OttesenSCG-928-F15]